MARSQPRGSGGKKAIDKLGNGPWARRPEIGKLEGLPGPGDDALVLVGTDPTSWGIVPSISSGVDPGSYAVLVLTYVGSGLIGYWRLGEGTGNWLDTSGYLTAKDLSLVNRGTDLTRHVTGGLPTAYDDGALQFPASGDYISNNGSGRYDFTGVATSTVACWVKVNANASTFTGQIVGNMLSSPPSGWALHVAWPTRAFTFERYATGGPSNSISAGSLLADEWIHVATTYDGTTAKVYLNGTLATSAASAAGLPAWNGGIEVGGGFPNGSTNWYFDGYIDELALWSIALSAAQVSALAARGMASSLISEGKFLMADGSGGTSWEFPLEVTY